MGKGACQFGADSRGLRRGADPARLSEALERSKSRKRSWKLCHGAPARSGNRRGEEVGGIRLSFVPRIPVRDRPGSAIEGTPHQVQKLSELLARRFLLIVASGFVVVGCSPIHAGAPIRTSAAAPRPAALNGVPASAPKSAEVDAAIYTGEATARGASWIGPNDLLEIAVLESPELNRSVRVTSTGLVSLPLLGEIVAAGRTPRELELAVEASLRERYIRDPHVSVQIIEMQGHAVSVIGSVTRPGVFQIREPRSLLEVLALAGGLTKEAGEGIIVMRGTGAYLSSGAAPPSADRVAVEIDLQALLESGDDRQNITVYPGDVVKVIPAGLIYVVGEVRRPGAFPLDRRNGMTVLQAIALGEGLGPKAAKRRALLIRRGESGERIEIPVNINHVISGRMPDPAVQPRDVIYIPGSAVRSVAMGTVDALVRMVTFRGVF